MENNAVRKRKQVSEGYLIIGVDPHKRRHAAVAITQDFSIRDKFKFDNTREGLETLVHRVKSICSWWTYLGRLDRNITTKRTWHSRYGFIAASLF